MRFFDFEKLYIGSHGNPTKLLELFYSNKKGQNFIVNPKALVEAFWVSDQHKAEYLGLCALRNYANYVTDKTVDLELKFLPSWVPVEIVKENPLVQLTENKIIFIKEKQ